jgi:hypothetical protein
VQEGSEPSLKLLVDAFQYMIVVQHSGKRLDDMIGIK